MYEITLKDICLGIAEVLRNKYGCDVYADEIKQGFDEPCFFIEVINASQNQIGFYRHDRRQAFCIHYFPDQESDDEFTNNLKIMDMAEDLYFLLKLIIVNNMLIRGSNMKHKSDGGVLHFFVNYNYHLIERPDPEPLMKKLYHKEELKDE